MSTLDQEISAAVEGTVDEAVARKLIEHVGAVLGTIYGREGKGYLRRNIQAFNHAAKKTLWFVIVDLNTDADCAPRLVRMWLSDVSKGMCFRIAVREVEAWLLGDRQRIGQFLGVPVGSVPNEPESLPKPKVALLQLVSKSKRADIKSDMLPRSGSSLAVGPAYNSRIAQFVETSWRPKEAARACDSLARAIDCLTELTDE